MPPKKVLLKVIILGDSGVGKTSLMNRCAAALAAQVLSPPEACCGVVMHVVEPRLPRA